jgi:hypothetical protein
MKFAHAWWMAPMLAWSTIAGASGSIYSPPASVVVGHERGLLIATLDQEHERWVSLCKDDPRGSFEFDVRELDRYGPLFDARLHWEGSGGFMTEREMPPEFLAFAREGAIAGDKASAPAQPPKAADVAEAGEDETTVLPDSEWHTTAAGALAFTTAKTRADGSDVDYWQMSVVMWSVDGRLYPQADLEATPADRDGVPLHDAESQRSRIGVTLLPPGRCKLPDLRLIQRRAASE